MRLEINGIEADLGNNIIALTRQVINISNLALRNIDITNRLQLPKSNQNQIIFNSADRVETNSAGLDVLYKCKIIDTFFVFNGVGFLNEASNYYSLQLVDESKELFNQLNDKINLLQYDNQDFTFNGTSYNSLKLLNTSNLWVWSIVAMHEQKTVDKTRFTSGDNGLIYSRPLFSFKKILTDLIEAKGWAINFDTDIVDNLAISSNAQAFYVTSYQKTFAETLSLSGEQNLNNLNTNDFENEVTTGSTTITIGNYETIFRLRGNIASDTDVIIKFISTSVGSSKQQTKEFKVKSNETYIDLKTSAFKPSSPDTSASVEITIEGTGDIQFLDTLLYTIIEETKLGDLSDNNLIGFKVKAFDNIPDKKQIDIFRDALKITNSIIVPDTFNKIIYVKSLKNLSKINSIDWSEKFDADNYTQTNRISGYAQINNLIYDNDDFVNSDLGKETFTINNQSLKDSEDILQLEYGASNEVSIEGYTQYPVASFDVYNDTERLNKINDRLLYVYNDSGNTYTLARFLNIDWRTLKDEYYSNWLQSFSRLRIVEGYADLNKLDVISHNFINLVYIDHFKSSFFVHIIEDFVPNRKTKIELLKFL